MGVPLMHVRWTLGRHGFVAGSAAALGAFVAIRLTTGSANIGATWLLLVSAGLALLPWMPRATRTPVVLCALFPAAALAAFSVLITSISTLGAPLTPASAALAVGALVLASFVASLLIPPDPAPDGSPAWAMRRELVTLALLSILIAFALASSWDIAYPLQVKGTDLGHYLLYADEAASRERLLVDDPYAGEPNRTFADPPAVGALYGSFLILDGISSWALGVGLILLSAASVLSVFAAAAVLWGRGAGLVAAAAYAVAPIRLDLMYWHGLGTTLALVFVPLVVLGLALMFRNERDWRVVGLTALALVGVAASHATSAVVVAVLVLVAPLVDLGYRLLTEPRGHRLRAWLRDGLPVPVLAACVAATVLGAGVIAHLRAQAADLGRPVDYRFLGPDWLDSAAVSGYFSWRFLGLAAIATALVVSSPRLRRDRALLGVLALGLACVLVNESWRVAFPFEYRRVVYYFGVALALVIGAAFLRFRLRPAWIAAWVLALLLVAQVSIGLRLPERVLEGSGPGPLVVPTLLEFRRDLDSGRLPDTQLVVTDACLHFAVPYLIRRPTIPAFGERQVGFENRLPLARRASAILEGGQEGMRLARSLGVGYAIVDPRCVPGLPGRLGGNVVIENDEVVVVRLPGAA